MNMREHKVAEDEGRKDEAELLELKRLELTE
jgi:hypothetical protein